MLRRCSRRARSSFVFSVRDVGMHASVNWTELTATAESLLAADGLDLVAPLALGWHDRRVEPVQRLRRDTETDATLGLVIGNTRAIWPVLRARCDASAADPVDDYIEAAIERAMRALAKRWPTVGMRAVFGHHGPPYVPMQAIAEAAGVARRPPSHLSVHSTFGPWIALRAVVIVEIDGPQQPPSLPPPCDCERGCLPAFREAMAAPADMVSVAERWRLWVAVRDACPVGAGFRYSEAQLRYHYTKDRTLLR